jgi:NitT/TauT family transport system substrate-binding protein
MNTRRTLGAAASLVTTALLLTACGGGAGGGAEQEGDAAGLTPVRVASLSGGSITVAAPIDVAMENGYFEDEGLAVEFIETDGGGAIVQAVLAGQADIGTQTGTTSVLAAVSQGADLRIIGSAFKGFDGIWVGPARDDINGRQDMGGEVIGFSSPGSSSEVAAQALIKGMEDQGQEPVRAEAIGGTSDQLTAAETGQIMAAYANPPVGLDEVQDGSYEIFFNAFQDLPQYTEVTTRVTFTTQGFLDQNPAAAEGFLNATQQAWDFMFEQPDQACEIWLRRSELPYSQASCVEAVKNYYTRESAAATPIGNLEQSVADGIAFGALERELNAEELESAQRDLLGGS